MEKIQNKYFNTALVDADYIMWIACNPNKVLGSNGYPLKVDNKFVYTPKTVQEALDTCDAYIKDILNFTQADSYIMFLTTGTTFRFEFDKSYKANRVGMEKPLWFHEVKAHMIKEWDAVEVPGLEADDLVVITKNHMNNCFIVAADKDIIDCVPGKHFDARKGRTQFVTTSESEAEYSFAKSLLTGDSVDGIPNLVKGMGPKTAEGELAKRIDHHMINPLYAAFTTFVDTLGETQGIERFYKQYKLLKIVDSLDNIPEGIVYSIPEPNCFNCLEAVLSAEHYQLKYYGK